MKVGRLYQYSPPKFYRLDVWENSVPEDRSTVSFLYKGDFFVLLNPNVGGRYSEILVCKDGKSGFIANLREEIGEGYFVEVKEVVE